MRLKIIEHDIIENDGPKTWHMTVDYEFANESHMFTSKDLRGLFIASEDLERSISHIAPAIKALLYFGSDKVSKNIDVHLE